MAKLSPTLFYILSCLLFSSCKPSADAVVDVPTIVAGRAKIIGRITSSNGANKDINVIIGVPHPVSGEYIKYNALVDRSGKFSIDVDVETDVSMISLYASLNPVKSLYFKLKSGSVTNIDIAYNSNFDIESVKASPEMNKNDMTLSLEVMGKMIDYKPNMATKSLYDKSPDIFLDHVKTATSERLEILNNETLISKERKELLSKDFRLFIYAGFVFDYEKYMMLNYRNVTQDDINKPVIQKVDKSYYGFLRDFKLNDPQYLNCYSFIEAQNEILGNEILGLPVIEDSNVPAWLAKVKVILSDLVGFSDGPYYDILAANAYGRQLAEEVKPLSEMQKKNIAAYWKDGEIAKILLRKNKQVVELDKFKSPVVVNDISSVFDDKVMETIVAKYKGKVVFIDLWATWCSPCLQAMQEFRSAKGDFHDKSVAFVYLTNGSSPRKLWEEKIKGIGSEHYYLEASQWKYIMNNFGFEGIPSYLLYNKEGVLMNKFTGFPGNDKVKGMINGLL